MEKLRDEILQAESVRSDLLKWKLGLVGTIGAAGLGFAGFGFSGSTDHLRHADLVLCAIPPVALYVDLLCLHLTLRILVIGSFLQNSTHAGAEPARVYREYETFAHKARELPEPPATPEPSATPPRKTKGRPTKSAFDLEDWALIYSTWGLSAAVGAYGVYWLTQSSWWVGLVFLISGASGVLATLFGHHQYAVRCRRIAAFSA